MDLKKEQSVPQESTELTAQKIGAKLTSENAYVFSGSQTSQISLNNIVKNYKPQQLPDLDLP